MSFSKIWSQGTSLFDLQLAAGNIQAVTVGFERVYLKTDVMGTRFNNYIRERFMKAEYLSLWFRILRGYPWAFGSKYIPSNLFNIRLHLQ